jgi:hypothetical protein
MPDWVDHVVQPVIDATVELCQNRTREQVIGIFSAVSAACVIAGMAIAIMTGVNFGVLAWYAFVALASFFLCCALYCLLADHRAGKS